MPWPYPGNRTLPLIMDGVREPVGKIVSSLERLDEEAGNQIKRINAGKGPQQPVCGARTVLPVST